MGGSESIRANTRRYLLESRADNVSVAVTKVPPLLSDLILGYDGYLTSLFKNLPEKTS